jgi:hypothetical protein
MENELMIIKNILARHKQQLIHEFYISEIGIFGSYARGEQKKGSDVDILVKFNKEIGWEITDLREYLENILDKKVDLVTLGAIRPEMRDRILKELVTV